MLKAHMLIATPPMKNFSNTIDNLHFILADNKNKTLTSNPDNFSCFSSCFEFFIPKYMEIED